MSESKILNHPDREEIIQKLLDGVSPNGVLTWLQGKYPNEKQHHITVATISKFRKEYLNLNREAARLIKKERKKQELGLQHNPNINAFIEKASETEEEHSLRVKSTLFHSPTYRDKLKEITDAQLDAPRLLKELITLLSSRLEVYYNEIASATTASESLKADKMFAEYVSLMKDMVKDSKKVWDDYNSQPDEGAVDLNVVQEQIGMVRDVVKDLLGELDPALALEFMDRLNSKLSGLKYEAQKAPDILERVEKLNEKIREMQEQAGDA